MVKIAEVRAANQKATTSGIVAVVVGGTNGIGRAFLTELAASTESSKVYIVGRSSQTLDKIQSELTSTNSSNTYISIQADDLTLLSNVEKATQKILDQEKSKIDLLFMSPGYITFAARDESTEGLDKVTSIRYYARMRFILNLLPLLESAPSPRVVSVLAGGLEGTIFPDDLDMKDPAHYGLVNAANMSATVNTLGLEQLQKQHPKISFVHTYPGAVRTNLLNTEHFNIYFKVFMNWIILPVLGPLFMMSPEDAGARALYAATSPAFGAEEHGAEKKAKGSNGVVGSGVYTLSGTSDAVSNDKVLKPYREEGMDVKIWQHTMDEYKRILG